MARRQSERLELIASENYVSAAVRAALTSPFEDLTIEGYPGRRLHGPNEIADELELAAIGRAAQLFGCRYANVQPHSGTQANQAVYLATLRPGDVILSMNLTAGGHFSHAATSAALSGYRSVHYGLGPDGIDMSQVERLARAHRPRIIVCGASSYPRAIDFAGLARIAHAHGALLMADIAHVAGLVAQGLFPNPFPAADIVTTTTYKNLRGPRGGLILTNDPELAGRIDAAVCPGLQGVPSVGAIAAKAVAFGEALAPAFWGYANRSLSLARTLAAELIARGYQIHMGGTDTPLVVLDFARSDLSVAHLVATLDAAGIGANAVPLPGDCSFAEARGLRLGLSAMATRGTTPEAMAEIAEILTSAINEVGKRADSPSNQALTDLRRRVLVLTARYPVPARTT